MMDVTSARWADADRVAIAPRAAHVNEIAALIAAAPDAASLAAIDIESGWPA